MFDNPWMGLGMLGSALSASDDENSDPFASLLPMMMMGGFGKQGGTTNVATPNMDSPAMSPYPLMSKNPMGNTAPTMTQFPVAVPKNQPAPGLYSDGLNKVLQGNDLDKLVNAISSLESGHNYAALGPATRSGDRAYGRYQVMGANVPSWTKTATGQSLTPQQFLADKTAQDAVAKHFLGQYLQKYGNPQDAASMWFSGRPMRNNVSKDILGTSVPQYVKRINQLMSQ